DCHAPYHSECWQENAGCAVYGCPQVPPTAHREALEIPAAYWGQENKPCPACGQQILAAAVRCRHCGATFASGRPEPPGEFRRRADIDAHRPRLRRQVIWFFVFCVMPFVAPVAVLLGLAWYSSHREAIRALPALYPGLCKIALGVGIGQTLL